MLDHLCRVPGCVNPFHLEAVTNEENIRRGKKGVLFPGHCVHGHDYTPENTIINKKGRRVCRACKRTRDLRYVKSNER